MATLALTTGVVTVTNTVVILRRREGSRSRLGAGRTVLWTRIGTMYRRRRDMPRRRGKR